MTDRKVFVKFKPIARSTEIGTDNTPLDAFTPARHLSRSPPRFRTNSEGEEIKYNLRSRRPDPTPQEEESHLETEVSETQETVSELTTIPPKQSNMAQNTTISDASKNARTPAVPKFIAPTQFNPTNTNAIVFLRNYERCAALNGWDDAFKINYMGSFLEAAASTWYSKFVVDPANAGRTWKELQEEFVNEFGSENAIRAAKFRFNTRRHLDNEDIKSYFFDLKNLGDEANPNMPFEAFRDKFESGLHPLYYESYFLIAPDNMNMEALKSVVFKLSNVKERVLSLQMSNLSLLAKEEEPQQAASSRHQQSSSPRPWYSNTRGRSGQPRCTLCNRYGHFRSTCRNGNPRNHPPRSHSPANRSQANWENLGRRSQSPYPRSSQSRENNHPNGQRRHH